MLGHTVFVTATIAICIICLLSSCNHIWKFRNFKDILSTHNLITHSLVNSLAVGVILAEMSIATIAIVALTSNLITHIGLWIAGSLTAFLFAAYAVYLNNIRSFGSDTPASCGCGVGEVEVGNEAVYRAIASGALGLMGFWGIANLKGLTPIWSGDFLLFALAGLSVAIVVTWLPVTLWSRSTLLEMASP